MAGLKVVGVASDARGNVDVADRKARASQYGGRLAALMVPDRATDAHLRILSELAEMFSDKAFREHLLVAASATDLHALISNWRSRVPDQHSPAV